MCHLNVVLSFYKNLRCVCVVHVQLYRWPDTKRVRKILVRPRIGGRQNNCFANDFRSPPLGVKTMQIIRRFYDNVYFSLLQTLFTRGTKRSRRNRSEIKCRPFVEPTNVTKFRFFFIENVEPRTVPKTQILRRRFVIVPTILPRFLNTLENK